VLRQKRSYARRDNIRRTVYIGDVPLSETANLPVAASVVLPDVPALVAGFAQAAWLTADGEVETVSLAEAARRAKATPPFLCHARATARRLNTGSFAAFDLLELFAFVYPAKFCLPTPRGLAAALGLPTPKGIEAEALALIDAARALLARLNAAGDKRGRYSRA
jgi:ATP-dependent DNA helicase DinG